MHPVTNDNNVNICILRPQAERLQAASPILREVRHIGLTDKGQYLIEAKTYFLLTAFDLQNLPVSVTPVKSLMGETAA